MCSINTLLLSAVFILGAVRVSQQITMQPSPFPAEEVISRIDDVKDLPDMGYCLTDNCLNLNVNGMLTGLKPYKILSFRHSKTSTPIIVIWIEHLQVTFESFGNDEQREKWVSPNFSLSVRVYLTQGTECHIKGVENIEFYQVDDNVYQCQSCTLFNEAAWNNVKVGLMTELKTKYFAAVTEVLKKAFENIEIC